MHIPSVGSWIPKEEKKFKKKHNKGKKKLIKNNFVLLNPKQVLNYKQKIRPLAGKLLP